MFRQNIFRGTASATLLLALCLSLFACSSQTSEDKLITPVEQTPSATSQGSNEPVPDRLLIPAIQVDAPIEQVGITASGDLATPTRSPWIDTGWYSNGPHPGDTGSAVIDGHLDRPGGFPAVFWLLRQIHLGDSVQVHESNGKTLGFLVTDVEYYAPQNAPLQQIFGNDGGKYLNLITCAGDWIPSQHQTTLRLVIYTKLTTR